MTSTERIVSELLWKGKLGLTDGVAVPTRFIRAMERTYDAGRAAAREGMISKEQVREAVLELKTHLIPCMGNDGIYLSTNLGVRLSDAFAVVDVIGGPCKDVQAIAEANPEPPWPKHPGYPFSQTEDGEPCKRCGGKEAVPFANEDGSTSWEACLDCTGKVGG